MNKKIGFVVASTLFLVIALFSSPLTFAQSQNVWDYCKVSAYGTNLVEDFPIEGSFSFTVVAPPTGSDIPNLIEVKDYNGGENYTKILSVGVEVQVSTASLSVITKNISPAAEENHYTINYEGEAMGVLIGGNYIPEFSPIIIVPMFMVATVLAIIYRRKRTSQNQTTD